jgi:hypothetical protein
LPRVLSVEEVARLLAGASNPKHRAALAVVSAGVILPISAEVKIPS